jgi:glycosyltransferase involved in cell wall biosynthesis
MTDSRRYPEASVVVPVYNERATITEILARIQAVAMEKEIIVVDDGSTDGTRELLADLARRKPAGCPGDTDGSLEHPGENEVTGGQSRHNLGTDNIRIFFQDRNQGKGAALRRGFEEARGEIVIVQDADLEYDPQDYFGLLNPIQSGVADVVYGSRFLGGPHRVLFYWHSVGNWMLTTLSNILTNLNLTDVWTCYKVFRREILQGIELREDRFGFEAEITAKVAKLNCRIYEVPISYQGRTYSEGKKITWRDGIRGVWCTLRYSLFE